MSLTNSRESPYFSFRRTIFRPAFFFVQKDKHLFVTHITARLRDHVEDYR